MNLRHFAKICKKRSFPLPLTSCITVLFVLLCATRLPAAPANTTVDIFTLGIAELMNIEVTSASKKVQRVADVGAAVFVITQEDMRRSGARSIPEALRLAPGVQVARIDANKWAVSIRGFNGRFANKLLVLIDGRSVYTPLFSGVFWDTQDTLLADIDRIEVIRGPGAALWGAGYRFSRDDIENTFAVSLLPPQKDSHLTSFFLHDEIELIPEHLSLILGSRFERNNYSGFEIQPNGRLIWTPTPRHTLWTAVSRAVRTPSRGDQSVLYRQSVIPPPLAFVPFPANQFPAVVTIYGSEEYASEELLAYELGYRTELRPNLNLDVSTFYNAYNHLRTVKAGQPGPDSSSAPTHIIIPFITNNDMTGHTYGAELAVSWLPLPWWRLQASYSYLKIFMDMNDNTTDPYNKADTEGGSPQQQFSLRSGFDFGRSVSWDLWLRGVDHLELPGGAIAAYTTLDTRLAWKPIPQLELSLVGQNLLQKSHAEFRPELLFSVPTEMERSFYGMLTWNF